MESNYRGRCKNLIELDSIRKEYGTRIALESLSLVCRPGEITMLIGPSGCGKTTALKLMNRLLEADGGRVLIRDRDAREYDVVELRRSIGYAIQEVGLFPHYSVRDNIAVVPRLLGWDEDRVRARVLELLHMVTLDESYADQYPAALSGGERQRVGLARALAADPDILLMDEPFGAIDPINRTTIHNTFLEIQERLGKTIVIVSHDIDEAIKLGDRIAVLKDGRLLRHDTPAAILADPGDDFVADLLGRDRNLKALSLKKAREIIQHEGYLKVTAADEPGSVRARLIEDGIAVALIVDESDRLIGRYVLDRRVEGHPMRRDDAPLTIERNVPLNATLSSMLASGEQLLPVLGPERVLLGAVSLGRLFSEVAPDA